MRPPCSTLTSTTAQFACAQKRVRVDLEEELGAEMQARLGIQHGEAAIPTCRSLCSCSTWFNLLSPDPCST
jgi:hypothetical protein